MENARQKVMAIIMSTERKLKSALTAGKTGSVEGDKLPVIDVEVRNIETVKAIACTAGSCAMPTQWATTRLKRTDRKAQQAGTVGAGGSGCGGYDGNPRFPKVPIISTIQPKTKMSWNYSYHNISSAWTKSTGAGIKVMVIDTGCES